MIAKCPKCGVEQCWSKRDKRPPCANCAKLEEKAAIEKPPRIIKPEETKADHDRGFMGSLSDGEPISGKREFSNMVQREGSIQTRKKRFRDPSMKEDAK